MANKITRKELLSLCEGKPVVRAGYCEMQFLLRYCTPRRKYVSRKYGWLADVYEVDGVIIITGYDTAGKLSPRNPIRHAESIAEDAHMDLLPVTTCRRRTDKALTDLLRLFRKEYDAVEARG